MNDKGGKKGDREGREKGRKRRGDRTKGDRNNSLSLMFQIEEHLMVAESRLEEQNLKNEYLTKELEDARRSK